MICFLTKWYVEDVFEELAGRVHEDWESSDEVDEEEHLHSNLNLGGMRWLKWIRSPSIFCMLGIDDLG